ncbi:MAG: hypothetical protein WDO13_08535 [Verrucomicrobiota bacterium]
MLSEDPLALTNPWEMVLENRLTSNGLPTTGFFPETDPNNSANYFWPISGGTSAPQKYTAPGKQQLDDLFRQRRTALPRADAALERQSHRHQHRRDARGGG